MNLELVKNILYIIYAIICVAIIILTLVQKSEANGAPETITGSSSNNFYDKNKGRTGEGRLKKWTVILGIVFVVLTIVLSILTIA